MNQAVLCYVTGLASAALAVFLWARERPSPARWALVGCLLSLAIESVLAGVVVQPAPLWPWLPARFTALLFVPVCLLTFSFSYARGDASNHLRRWRGALWALALIPLPIGYWIWTQPGLRTRGPQLSWPEVVAQLTIIVTAILALTGLEHTLRGAMGVMRWRVKYLVMGLATLLVTRVYTSSQELLLGFVDDRLLTVNALALLLCIGLLSLAFRRGKLLSVDLYLSQHALYRSMTLLLAGSYLLGVGLFSRIAMDLGGDTSPLFRAALLLVALLGLAILLLSDRMRQQVKRFISRHFHRPEHDYRQVWTRFAGQTELNLDAPTVCRSAAKLVSETFEALSVSIWMVAPGAQQLCLGASTSLSAARARELGRLATDDGDMLTQLAAAEEPFLVDPNAPVWARPLLASNPDSFLTGDPACVPLRARNQLMGVLMVGDRVNGRAYSVEDLDLLHIIGDHIAASLYTIRVAGQLLEAREFEAFQTMSAFFVHDLKNTTSTLALMLQNLPSHFEDPAFREDVLRSMGSAVGRMKDLIGRLTMLRRGLDLQPKTVDPHQLVHRTLAELKDTLPTAPVLELRPVPDIVCDPDQMKTVLTNLLLNARDAAGDQGEIQVSIEPTEQGIAIRVRDDGPGISPDILDTSLFRPFCTTKKEGLGIGLFHSRMIVEAHQGTLTAENRPSQGAAFHVTLPLHPGTSTP